MAVTWRGAEEMETVELRRARSSEAEEAERLVLEKIREIQEHYQRELKPWMDELARLESLKTRTIVVIPKT